MSQLDALRFVELYNLAVQRNIQSGSRDRDLNEIRVCSLVSCYFAGTEDPVLRGRFHVTVPHREKLSTPGGGKRRVTCLAIFAAIRRAFIA